MNFHNDLNMTANIDKKLTVPYLDSIWRLYIFFGENMVGVFLRKSRFSDAMSRHFGSNNNTFFKVTFYEKATYNAV